MAFLYWLAVIITHRKKKVRLRWRPEILQAVNVIDGTTNSKCSTAGGYVSLLN